MKALKYSIIACTAIILGLLCGCRGPKGVVGGDEPTRDGGFDMAHAWDSMISSYGDWTDVELPVKMTLESPKRISFSGRVTMVRNGAINISVRALGFEVGSLYIDGETITLIAKPMSAAYTENTAMLLDMLGLTMSDFQNMLLGRVFTPGNNATPERRHFELAMEEVTDNEIIWAARPKGERPHVCFTLNTTIPDGDTWLNMLNLDYGPGAGVVYDQPIATDFGPVAKSLSMASTVRGRDVQATILWTAANAKWNRGIRLSAPQIPNNYRRLNTAEMIALIKRL